MKKLLIALLLGLSLQSFSQEIFQTKNCSINNQITTLKLKWEISKENIIFEIIDEAVIKIYKKNGYNIKTEENIPFELKMNGNYKTYYFQDNNRRIIITESGENKWVVRYEIKDNFTNNITQILYY